MFRRDVKPLGEILLKLLRDEGLETPLQQKRLIDAWETVAGPMVASYTTERFIKNKTLFVKIINPALRHDLSMMRTQLMRRLNEQVGALIITDIKVY